MFMSFTIQAYFFCSSVPTEESHRSSQVVCINIAYFLYESGAIFDALGFLGKIWTYLYVMSYLADGFQVLGS